MTLPLKPTHIYFSGLFERTMKRRGVREMDPFDWEKTSEHASGSGAAAASGTTGAAHTAAEAAAGRVPAAAGAATTAGVTGPQTDNNNALLNQVLEDL